ncbi:MAG: polyisoprenoid-binding protein [Gemmatimonadetes bacterium]|nr:polyisoprenoid-binding protein [Gemmatimonadota bacterium]
MLLSHCRGLALGILAFVVSASPTLGANYSIDIAHSSVGFSVRHLVSRTTGRFTDFKGKIVYDEANPGASMVNATIQISSIDTDNERRDNHLRSADFFDAEKYPEMTFVSSKVEKKGETLMVTGDLTLHGVTHQVVLPVEVLGVGVHPMTKAAVAGFQVELTLNRSNFGVNSWTDAAGILGDEVRVSLLVEAAADSGNPCNVCNPCGENPCKPCAKNPCNPCGE